MALSRTSISLVLSTLSGTSAEMLDGVYRDKQDQVTKIEAARVAGDIRGTWQTSGTVARES